MYKLPDGSVTDELGVYHQMWRHYATALEALIPGVSAVGFDPGITLVMREGAVTLPIWFVVKLVENTRTKSGRKFKPLAVRSQPCELCSKTVHTFGAGRNRRYCRECVKVRAKMTRGGKDD